MTCSLSKPFDASLAAQGVRRIPRGQRSSTRGNEYGLTRREAQIFGLLSEGLSNAALAKRLFLSTMTIDYHVSAILTKLGVPSRAQAVAMARRKSGDPAAPFLATEEWYEYDAARTKLNQLLSVDEKTFKPKANWGAKSGKGMGAFHPTAWYHEYDGGRAFYTSPGHCRRRTVVHRSCITCTAASTGRPRVTVSPRT